MYRQTAPNNFLKKFGVIFFLLAVAGTAIAFSYGGVVGNFVGYLAVGCTMFGALFYFKKIFG
ncbi:MAG: hypothetical protein IH840_00950 [Candidatus Heimdallarchaeota archaeon]|nr:hypothetical protein [Candidatus Heimdallarchaeota archaeon]